MSGSDELPDGVELRESDVFLTDWLAFARWAHVIAPEELAEAKSMAEAAFLAWRATELEP